MPYIPKQYDSAKTFLGSYNNLGNITDALDNSRISAYSLYDDFYFNRPDTFKVTLRGTSDTEIYLPSTKKIVDATARFLAVDFDFTIAGGSSSALDTLLRNIFKREEISKRFIKGKRSYLTRGDQVWYITADPAKKKGEKLNIGTIHPSSVFRIENPNNAFQCIGYHIVDIVRDPREKDKTTDKKVARRQTYRKEPNGRISTEAGTFEIGAWDDRSLTPDKIKPVTRLWAKYELPEQITALPVYHIPNNEPDGSTWGLSQVAGIEYIINALNQSITYEDLSLVLQGLGVYVTTAAPPIDAATGKKAKYKLHPGNVVEMSQGDTFERVTGIASVQPFQEHLKLLDEWATSGAGIPDMATGNIDVSVAQSGIALALKMGPIIAENSDKQLGIGGKWDQLGYDVIHGWLPAYEGLNSPNSVFTSVFGDPMPVNREAYIQETLDLFNADTITLDEVRDRLEKIGYKKTAGVVEELYSQMSRKATALAGDVFGSSLEGTGAPDFMDQVSLNGAEV
jgi:hypothetical protein